MSCTRRFTTYERLDEVPLMVVKKDGRREAFPGQDHYRCLEGFTKRPISYEVIENLARDIEREPRNQMEREVPSQIIGEMVMERLRQLDEAQRSVLLQCTGQAPKRYGPLPRRSWRNGAGSGMNRWDKAVMEKAAGQGKF